MRGSIVALLAGTGALALSASASALPIIDTGTPSLPAHSGAAAKAHKIKDPTIAPQNPYMTSNPNSNIHNDTWMTDAYQRKGPLGNNLQTSSGSFPPSLCGSITFDSQGRILSICPSSVAPPTARLIDPSTLAQISSYVLPTAPNAPGTKEYQNFTGGGYFFVDNKDRITVATKTDHIFVLSEGPDGNTLTLESDYDLTPVLDEDTERISSALPDFNGLIWFVSKNNGKVGTLNTKTGAMKVKTMNEEIENSFAVGEDGVYIVSDKRMYRFKATGSGMPKVVWQKGYPNSGIVKPSQVDAGSGTTPTLMDNGLVSITDNADPMDVVVYRTAKKLKKGEKRVVCKEPIFGVGASATENSIITAGRSLLVENNYGYQDPFGPTAGAVTEPGFVRVDVRKDLSGCKTAWTNREVRSPTVVPKLSTKTGLIYTYQRPPDDAAQGYYWTAIDWRNGKTVWTQYAGSGLSFNNNYAGLALGPDGTAYLGVIGGIIALRDGS
ncbi:MAG: hypothetical protein QOI10_2820 [Solirubrobacterales bacterium]|jgi:outer membrane protein assembly factor BamB|nr:hypothetical protein [Solirubrobacterales bacterium]